MTRSWYRGIITAVIAVGLLLTQVGNIVALATTATPFGPERFASDHATYVIDTKSAYYRHIWEGAISAWNKTGAFHFKQSSAAHAQIQLSTASQSQSAAMGQDVGLTDFWSRNDYLKSVKSTLNAQLLQEYGYSRSDDLHVAEHELGHTMGLGHNPSKHSVMYYRNRDEGIQKVDIQAVKLRYTLPAGEAS